MKIPNIKIAALAQVLLLLAFATGCKTVVRENVIATVDTGIGVTLAENPKTESYEAKVGFVRSQFYSVPTAKNVDTKDPTHLSNDAGTTPELVSGIRMESDARHLILGVSVSESFAVGKVAVMSPAAVAMYVSDAKNADTANAAATATKNVADTKEFTAFKNDYALQQQAFNQIKQGFKDPAKKANIRTAANTLNIVPAAVPDPQFIKNLNLYVDGSPDHTDPLNDLAKQSQ